MDAREKEQYLREYSALKAKGKPFFPYAVGKDSLMAVIVLIVIILMSLILGAELGPKADPTTTSYVPRPEWYFFFLFELLRVIKPPELVFVATLGIPNIAHRAADSSPVLRPWSRASPRASPDRHDLHGAHDRRDDLPHAAGFTRRLADRDRHGSRPSSTSTARKSPPTLVASVATSSVRTATTVLVRTSPRSVHACPSRPSSAR